MPGTAVEISNGSNSIFQLVNKSSYLKLQEIVKKRLPTSVQVKCKSRNLTC